MLGSLLLFDTLVLYGDHGWAMSLTNPAKLLQSECWVGDNKEQETPNLHVQKFLQINPKSFHQVAMNFKISTVHIIK